jgi:xylan 1,4-beta-xylosidase
LVSPASHRPSARAAVVAGAFVSAWLCSTASAEAAGEVSIAVDATAPGAPLEPVWRYYGYDELNYTTTPEGEALLRTLAAAHAAPVHVRTHFLFNTGDGTPALKWGSTNLYSEDAGGNPVYDYTLIDSIMDATVESGVLPLVELGFMPQALSIRPDPYQNSNPYVLDGGAFYPPRDYDRWAALVTAWATHVKERYPGAESSWQWELWNEPDIGYWHGTFEEYARLYDHTESALHAVFPDASLGGPAVARPEGSFLTQFLEHCASGTNAVSGQTGTRLDMVSFHAKGGVTLTDRQVQMDLGNQLRLHRAGFDAVAASAQFARTPIVISEADPDGCAACPATRARANAYRNSPAYGAYEVAMMKRTLDLAGEVGVNLRGVLTWAFTFPGTPYFAGYRALATNGIHLPVLNAFQLLGSLSGDRLPVTSSGALPLSELLESSVRGQPDIDALAARDGSRIQILVWHYHDDLVDAPSEPVTVNVSVPPGFGSSASVTHRRVDHAHGDAYSAWVSQGSPAAPSAAQLAALREAMVPAELSPQNEVAVVEGAVSLSFDLPRFGVSLLTLSPPNVGGAEASPGPDGACSCRLPSASRNERSTGLTLALVVALAAGRSLRRVGGSRRFGRESKQPRARTGTRGGTVSRSGNARGARPASALRTTGRG